MTVVTRCQILRLKCTKFDFGWGRRPCTDPKPVAYWVLYTDLRLCRCRPAIWRPPFVHYRQPRTRQATVPAPKPFLSTSFLKKQAWELVMEIELSIKSSGLSWVFPFNNMLEFCSNFITKKIYATAKSRIWQVKNMKTKYKVCDLRQPTTWHCSHLLRSACRVQQSIEPGPGPQQQTRRSTVAGWHGRAKRQTDARQFHRPCSA